LKTVGLLKVLFVVVPMVVMLRYPFIKDAAVTSVSYDGGRIIMSGTVRVLFTDEAWSEFGYKDGNFYWFNKWWQEEAPGLTYARLRLVSAEWVLIEHTDTYDDLGFTMVWELK
jgi:hypothetical protein